MAQNKGKNKHELFEHALDGKKIPLLTLDSKWYKLLTKVGREDVKPIEDQLNMLLKRQGKLNTETKEIKNLKKKLMGEIVTMVDEMEQQGNKSLEKKIDENKRLVEDCNRKLEEYEEELMEVPREIDRLNKQLMLMTMESCYDVMQQNTDEIQQITDWVTKIRIELKKQLVHKQEMEQRNHTIYSYMHDVFGADVVNIFDMRYNPEEHHPKTSRNASSKGSEGEDK